MYVDASHVGVGTVLVQDDYFGVERPVRVFSRKCNKHILDFSVIENETLALSFTLKHFDVYVCGSIKLVVYTDHNPLTFLNSLQCPNLTLIPWSLFL